MKKLLCWLMMLLCCGLTAQAKVKVAVLHPLLGEMAQAIGGDAVEVVSLVPRTGDLHSFSPRVSDVAAARGAQLVLACGMGVEPYLNDLRDSLAAETRLLEVGKTLPPVMLPSINRPDPHWWNCPQNMKRASRVLARELAELEPVSAAVFQKGQRAYAAEMDQLDRTARVMLAKVPQKNRVLVTAHAAMGHFCRTYGFTQISVHGVAHESEGDTATMARLLGQLRELQVRCVFTEVMRSPRALETLAAQVGAATQPLIPDGIHPEKTTFREIFLFNVQNIAKGLMGE